MRARDDGRQRLQGQEGAELGNLTSQDYDMFLRICCTDSSSPQISAILVVHFTCENDSLRNSPQNFHNNRAEQVQNPGSRNSLGGVARSIANFSDM